MTEKPIEAVAIYLDNGDVQVTLDGKTETMTRQEFDEQFVPIQDSHD